jgi:hypothetical protein
VHSGDLDWSKEIEATKAPTSMPLLHIPSYSGTTAGDPWLLSRSMDLEQSWVAGDMAVHKVISVASENYLRSIIPGRAVCLSFSATDRR